MAESNHTERTNVRDTVDLTQSVDRALQDARIGLWVWDMQSNKVYFSPEWKRQLGYQDHELRSRFGEFEERLHPQDRNSILATLKAYVEGRRPDYEVEFRLRHKDGTYRWIFSHAFLQTGADGKPCRVSGCHLDITERKEAQKERARLLAGIQASPLEADVPQSQLGNILESISDGFVALDKTWHYTYVNRQAAGLFGRSPQDLIGKHIWTEFPEGVGQPFHLAYEKAMSKQVFIQTENYYEPWDRWFENRIYPSSNGISIFFHEITDRKQAEQVARENAALLRGQNDVLELIAQGTPLAKTLDFLLLFIEAQCPGMLGSILLLDSDGVHVRHGAAPSLPSSFTEAIDGQRIGPSAGSCGTAAFRREPVIVEDIATDALWEDYRDFALKHDLRACWSIPIFDEQHQVLGTFALYFRTPGRPTARHWQLIETTTQAAAFAIVKQRETEARSRERKRTLEILEERVVTRTAELQAKNQELEHEISQRQHVETLLRARNEELKAFAYTVSHDLKAPLRGIDGYARELDRRHRQGLSERALFCLTQILTATQNLDRLIEDLLHYSRLDAETPKCIRVNLAQMVESILRDRKPVILERNADVVVNLSSASVHTWERGLFQVLTNLIDNALKYSRDARTPRIEITSQELADAVRIMISDNGIGFDMKYHDRIFGLFNRLVRQEEFDGTGAGLAIAKKVVEKLSGRIWAESKLGSGAKFFVEVPKLGPLGSGE
jgi:PAS domain S-box-containing protein